MTSFTKVWVVVSLIRSGTACGAGPPPCSTIVTVSSPDVLRRCLGVRCCLDLGRCLGIRGRSSTARGEVPHPLDGGLAVKFNRQAPSRGGTRREHRCPRPGKPRDLRLRLDVGANWRETCGCSLENSSNRSRVTLG